MAKRKDIVRTNIGLSRQLWKKLKIMSVERGTSLSELIEELLASSIEKTYAGK